MKAVNEVGPAAAGGSAGGTVILPPSAAVSGLLTSAAVNSPTVTVHGSRLTTGWENGESRQYAVSVTGPDDTELSDDGCSTGPVADTDSPSCTFDVRVSAPESVGTTTADGNGDISVTVYLPQGTPPGSHTLLATGLDANGAVLNLAKSVAVTVNPAPVWTPAPVTTPPTATPPTTTPPPTPHPPRPHPPAEHPDGLTAYGSPPRLTGLPSSID